MSVLIFILQLRTYFIFFQFIPMIIHWRYRKFRNTIFNFFSNISSIHFYLQTFSLIKPFKMLHKWILFCWQFVYRSILSLELYCTGAYLPRVALSSTDETLIVETVHCLQHAKYTLELFMFRERVCLVLDCWHWLLQMDQFILSGKGVIKEL